MFLNIKKDETNKIYLVIPLKFSNLCDDIPDARITAVNTALPPIVPVLV